MRAFDPATQLDLACEDLVVEHAGRLPASQVRQVFAEIVAGYAQAAVRTFLPVLVPRQVRQRLAGAVSG